MSTIELVARTICSGCGEDLDAKGDARGGDSKGGRIILMLLRL